MVKIKGELECKNCEWKEENVESNFQCPQCKGFNIKHTPPHKIYLCEKQNPEGHGRNSGKLANIHKKVLENDRNKNKTYLDIKNIINSRPLETWSSTKIIEIFGIEATTDGDVIRTILDLLVCEGFLRKKFMQGKKYHLYEKNYANEICPFLNKISKGKRIGVYKCSFDFKLNGKELDSFKVFNKNV